MSALHRLRRLVQRVGVDFQRFPEAHPLHQVSQLLRGHGIECVLDVGANTGQFVHEIRRLGYRGHVVSFEPLSLAFGRLEQACSKDASWECDRLAIGAEAGSATINVSANSVSSSMARMLDRHREAAPSSVYVDTETVPVATLDAVVARHRPPLERTYLKVDTQGFERHVLAGGAETLRTIAGVQMELSLAQLYEGQLGFVEGIHMMQDAGFALVNVVPGFSDPGSGETLQCDGVFFRVNR